MTTNLLAITSVVGILVVTELDYQEKFLLSICSSRTSLLVKKARTKISKLAFRLEECHGYNEFKIRVVINNTANNIWSPVTSLLHVHKLALKKVVTVKLGLDYKAATNFDSWCEEDGTFLHRLECANEPMAVQRTLQDYISSLFYSETTQLYLSMKCEGSLPNITNVKDIEIEDETIEPQFLAKA
ncbi:hypothetical protein L5515_008434 [Caenorhabditis briggsae]|uniref:Uncharacterized protein n=1 Tax=Caenorhabditis briggsae TaxID=6238 RepID=A0AAE9D1R5_CAEBR|nr:hypothetical protein L3Y34_008596 [Caenorhabditis briggsae]UMM36136.1 hypothetical protein L5515_008434 [Caenorhabditis briggsae]